MLERFIPHYYILTRRNINSEFFSFLKTRLLKVTTSFERFLSRELLMFQLIWINFASTLSLPHLFEATSIEIYSLRLVMLEGLSASCHCKTYCWKLFYVTPIFRKQFPASSIACNRRPPYFYQVSWTFQDLQVVDKYWPILAFQEIFIVFW